VEQVLEEGGSGVKSSYIHNSVMLVDSSNMVWHTHIIKLIIIKFTF
jgi:hypothetical protein